MPLHLLAISGGAVFRTIRRNATAPWAPWQNLNSVVGPLTAPQRVACAMVNGSLHICVLENGALWHTMETAPSVFTGWGPAHSVAFPGITMGSSVDCAAIGGQLHVCVEGRRHTPPIQTLPAVHRAIRIPSGAWSPPREIMQRATLVRDIACTDLTPATGSPPRPQLEVLARSQVSVGRRRTTIEALVHTTLLPTGAPNSDVNLVSSIPPAAATANVPGVRTIATAAIGSTFHIIIAQGTELFHTISGVGGFDVYQTVRALVGDAAFGSSPLALPACANVGGNLHLCAVSGSRIMHTIRLANGAWRNPEPNTVGRWGDVTAAVPGGIAAPFADIACAGDPF